MWSEKVSKKPRIFIDLHFINAVVRGAWSNGQRNKFQGGKMVWYLLQVNTCRVSHWICIYRVFHWIWKYRVSRTEYEYTGCPTEHDKQGGPLIMNNRVFHWIWIYRVFHWICIYRCPAIYEYTGCPTKYE